MVENELFIYRNIVKDMAEGVITIGFDGIITSINSACKDILGVGDEICGTPFAMSFFEYEQNDGFNQCVLDSIYENRTVRCRIADFYTGTAYKKLFITTSYLKDEGNRGVIVVINDVSELYELKDAIRAMEQIKALNETLQLRNKLISETFGRYLSDEIVKNLLDTPGGLRLGGRKQLVTIIMSDLRGFTAMSERMEPTDLILMLNNYLGDMTDIVQKYQGTIIEFIGDAIFAIFGAPINCDNPSQNAVSCAIEMQNRMEQVNIFNSQNGYPELAMGIGVNTGEVILGNIGSEKRAKYGVVGQNVNLCGRIESYTIGGQVLISSSTREGIEGLETRGSIEILPKGVDVPITVYDVVKAGAVELKTTVDELEEIEPISIDIHVIDGKFAKKETIPCQITQMSKKRLRVTLKMPKMTNVKFVSAGREVFGKYVEDDIIHITAGKVEI